MKPGDRLLVHSSLSALGFVAGGAQAVVQALQTAVGPNGLIVVPAFTSHLTDPRYWQAPPVPESWWPVIRAETPPFDPATTASRGIGRVAEHLRTLPGAVRGPHPHLSFAAWGGRAHSLVAPHGLGAALGESSPLARLYELDAKVVFLGTDYRTCTAFHLAQHRAGGLATRVDGAPMRIGDEARWVEFDSPIYDTAAFAEVGSSFEAEHLVRKTRIGAATCRAFPINTAVDFAEAWLGANRLPKRLEREPRIDRSR